MEIGERVKRRRLASQLTQEELAARAGLTKGFISQVERDLTSISLDSLAMIVGALDTSLVEFFAEESEKPIVFHRGDRVATAWGGSETLEVLIPGATNRTMDPILVHIQGGETFGCGEPHDGEEFGFVLSGAIRLEVGKTGHAVRAGDCFYYRAQRSHTMRNLGEVNARLLWIASPPRL